MKSLLTAVRVAVLHPDTELVLPLMAAAFLAAGLLRWLLAE